MRKVAVILLTLLYTVSTSGVVINNFYCCGKLKETYLFSQHSTSSGCKQKKKMPRCCDTRSFIVKVADNHSPTAQLKVNADNGLTLFSSPSVELFNFQKVNAEPATFTLINAPPLLSKQPAYLTNCVFRI